MKTNVLIFIAILAAGIAWVIYTDQVRDPKLMSLCADHQTRTLYECK